MKDCLFCKITNHEIPSHKIWDDSNHHAFLDINPINPGHTLVVPKNHTDYIFDIEDTELSSLFIASKKVAAKLKEKLSCERVGVIVEGFAVPHAHVHLIPINEGNELNPHNAKPASQEKLEAMCTKINA